MTGMPSPVTSPIYAGKRITIGCPHCASVLKVRSSRPVSSIVRQVTLVCLNDECCATFGADLTITHAIGPSARPNPAVHLKSVPPRRRPESNPANDDAPPLLDSPGGPEVPSPANDQVAGIATG